MHATPNKMKCMLFSKMNDVQIFLNLKLPGNLFFRCKFSHYSLGGRQWANICKKTFIFKLSIP